MSKEFEEAGPKMDAFIADYPTMGEAEGPCDDQTMAIDLHLVDGRIGREMVEGEDAIRAAHESSSSSNSSLNNTISQESTAYIASLPDPSVLTEDQKSALEAIYEGKNIFLTGVAGGGKSFLIEIIKREWKGMCYPLAPNRRAGNKWGCQTIDEFMKSNIYERTYVQYGKSIECKGKRKLLPVIIDEISEISAEKFDMLNIYCKKAFDNNEGFDKDKPFGGAQVIIAGDYHFVQQFKKPEDNNVCPNQIRNRGFAFQSDNWHDLNFEVVALKDNMRLDAEEDCEVLKNFLHKLREGSVEESDLDELKSAIPKMDTFIDEKMLYLCTTNKIAEAKNRAKLFKITTKPREFPPQFYPPDSVSLFEEDDKEGPSLEVGARVELNNDLHFCENTLVKGTRGVIEGFVDWNKVGQDIEERKQELQGILNTPNNDNECCTAKLKMLQMLDKLFENEVGINLMEFPVVAFDGETRSKIIYYMISKRERTGEQEAYMCTLPLKCSWAVTIHSTRGMTLDGADIDLDKAFAPGQVYSAMSRLRGLKRVQIHNIPADPTNRSLKPLKIVKDFMADPKLETLRIPRWYEKDLTLEIWYDEDFNDKPWEEVSSEGQCNTIDRTTSCDFGDWSCVFCGIKSYACRRMFGNIFESTLRSNLAQEEDIALIKEKFCFEDLVNILKENHFKEAKSASYITYTLKSDLEDQRKLTEPLRKLLASIKNVHKDYGGEQPQDKNDDDEKEGEGEVYVLELEEGKFYIGETSDKKKRIAEHRRYGRDPNRHWTARYKLIKEVPTKISQAKCTPNIREMMETLEWMHEKGIENVRGAQWASIELTNEQIQNINLLICQVKGLCFSCHEGGHKSSECQSPEKKRQKT